MPVEQKSKSSKKPGLLTRAKNRFLLFTEKKNSAMSVTHKDAMKWFKIRKSGYEDLISSIEPYVHQDSVIFDVGANVGFFSHMLAEKIGLKGSLYLYEPLPHLAKLCKETFDDTTYEANVFDYGLSDSDSEVDLFVASNGNLGWNTIIQSKASEDMVKVQIKLKKFENCKPEEIPTFIKIDVEGSEYMVLRGMLNSLREWTTLPVILCEVGWGTSHPNWEEELKVFNELKKIGYSFCNLEGTEIDESSISGTTDILLIPN